MTDADAHQEVHQAIGRFLDDGEIAIAWHLTIDIAGSDDTRYLAHRAGSGHDGTDAPMTWTVVGMLRASLQAAEDQLRDSTVSLDEDDDDDDN